MSRIAGINLPKIKRVEAALKYIYGIGDKFSIDICKEAKVNIDTRVSDLTEEQVAKIQSVIENDYKVEGALRQEVSRNIKALKDLKCYRGDRHIRGLPVRGQRSKTNAATCKKRRPKKVVLKVKRK